jgi:hypothetical protein
MRRTGGARVNSSQRVKLVRDGVELDGWVLNVSRGGTRIILEDTVAVGDVFMVYLGEDGEPDAVRRQGRVVWVNTQPDGIIAGLEYTDRTSSQSMPAMRLTSDRSDD